MKAKNDLFFNSIGLIKASKIYQRIYMSSKYNNHHAIVIPEILLSLVESVRDKYKRANMRNFLFLILFATISLFSSEDDRTPAAQALPRGYEIVSIPVAEETSATQEKDSNTIIQWAIRSSILALIIYFSLRRGEKTREEVEVIEDMQSSVFHPKETVMQVNKSKKPSLYQRIKAQPVATKRFTIVASMLWIIFETFIDFKLLTWNARDFRFNFDEYFIATFLPLIILYGIYWIILGIKK
jgi:hypothetical protein